MTIIARRSRCDTPKTVAQERRGGTDRGASDARRYPANMMVFSPGGYRFGDYWRLGLPLLLAWLAVALLIIPRVWPL